MKIAQIAPLTESCPPRLYGGTERIVSYLTEELVRQGHDVTLFASGNSSTDANLVACSNVALRLDPDVKDPLAYLYIMLDQVRRRAHEFDVLHFHVDYLHYPLTLDFMERTVTTMHGRLDLPELKPLHAAFPAFPTRLLYRMRSVNLSSPSTGWERYNTASRTTFWCPEKSPVEITSPSWPYFPRRNARTGRSISPPAPACR